MSRDNEAARARAEASFRKPEPRSDDAKTAKDAAERSLQEKTERLREARLAKEARERLGAEIRTERRARDIGR